MKTSNYLEKLKSPRWQKRRLEICEDELWTIAVEFGMLSSDIGRDQALDCIIKAMRERRAGQ